MFAIVLSPRDNESQSGSISRRSSDPVKTTASREPSDNARFGVSFNGALYDSAPVVDRDRAKKRRTENGEIRGSAPRSECRRYCRSLSSLALNREIESREGRRKPDLATSHPKQRLPFPAVNNRSTQFPVPAPGRQPNSSVVRGYVCYRGGISFVMTRNCAEEEPTSYWNDLRDT